MKKLLSLLIGLFMMLPMTSMATTLTSDTCVQRTTSWINWYGSLNQGYKAPPVDAASKIKSFCDAFSSQPYLGAEYPGLNQNGVWFWEAVEKYAALKTLGYVQTYPGTLDNVRTEMNQGSSFYYYQVGVPMVWADMDDETPCTDNYCALTGTWKK